MVLPETGTGVDVVDLIVVVVVGVIVVVVVDVRTEQHSGTQ